MERVPLLTGPEGKCQITSQPKPRWRPPFSLVLLLCVLLGFGGSVYIRRLVQPAVSPLENLIAANAPQENVHTLTFDPKTGDFLVGTNFGIIQGAGKNWSRIPNVEGDVTAILPAPNQSTLYLAGVGSGLLTLENGQLHKLVQDDFTALIADPQNPNRLVATTKEGLKQSPDGGKTWTKINDQKDLLAVTIDPKSGRMLTGGVQGTLWYSDDQGRTWATLAAPGGSITSLLAEPQGRLWMGAGGKVQFSDDGGNTWASAKLSGEARPVVAIAIAPTGSHDLWGVTADGLLRSVTDNK